MKNFIIRLNGNEISEKHARECVEQAAKFGIDVNYFDAVHGSEYTIHLEKLKILPRYKFKKQRIGVYGCFLSHYYLWKQCVEDNIPYTILEHDGYFINPMPNNVLDNFTDVLKLDTLDPYSKNYNEEIESSLSNQITYINYNNPNAKNGFTKLGVSKPGTGNYMRGAYGYIIKPHAAKKIIDWIAINGFVPADQQLGNDIVDIQVTIPTVVRLHPAYFRRINELSLTTNPELL